MGVATLGSHRFRLDPESVQWDFTIHAVDIPTVGGKVVQVLGTQLGDMTLTGSFGVGGWREQERFLESMKRIGTEQVNVQRISNSTHQPIRFKYPPKGWDFGVYLTGYASTQGRGSIQLDNAIVNPRWQLTLFIVEGSGVLKRVAQDVYIARLSAGLGWKQTEYNGPMGWMDVENVLQGRTIMEYISDEAGLSTGPPAGTDRQFMGWGQE